MKDIEASAIEHMRESGMLPFWVETEDDEYVATVGGEPLYLGRTTGETWEVGYICSFGFHADGEAEAKRSALRLMAGHLRALAGRLEAAL